MPTGQVAITEAGDLPCRFVIHAVGPVWRGGGEQEDELLRRAVWNSLMAAHGLKIASLALPAISSGIFGFPKDRCATILVQAAVDFCEGHPDSSVREIHFVYRDDTTAKLFVAEIERINRTLG